MQKLTSISNYLIYPFTLISLYPDKHKSGNIHLRLTHEVLY